MNSNLILQRIQEKVAKQKCLKRKKECLKKLRHPYSNKTIYRLLLSSRLRKAKTPYDF